MTSADVLHNYHYDWDGAGRGSGADLTPSLTPPPRPYGSVRWGVRPSSQVRARTGRSYTPRRSTSKPPQGGPVRSPGRGVRQADRPAERFFGGDLLGYRDTSDEPRISQELVAARFGNSDDPAWVPLRARAARPARAISLAAVLGTAAGVAILIDGPVDVAIAVTHLASTPASPLAGTAVLLAVLRLWRFLR